MTTDDAAHLLDMVRGHIAWHERILMAAFGALVAIAGGQVAGQLFG